MNLYADSVLRHIDEKVKKHSKSGQMLIIIPQMPEANLLSVADALSSHFLEKSGINLVFKISDRLPAHYWSKSGYLKAQLHDWVDEKGNLTYYRNQAAKQGKLNLVVLCTSANDKDAASLEDFYICNPECIWEKQMKKSFKQWMGKILKDIPLSKDDHLVFNKILTQLRKTGSDLYDVSKWLQELNFDNVNDAGEAVRKMLSSLKMFRLPVLRSFPFRKKGSRFSDYVDQAHSFFSGQKFMDKNARERARTRILELIADKNKADECLPGAPECYAPYKNAQEFLHDLLKLTDNHTWQSPDIHDIKLRLLDCDFAVINDNILKFKASKEKQQPAKESLKKVEGYPLEAILTAIWKTFSLCFSNRTEQTMPSRIAIIGRQLQHNFSVTSEDENDFEDENPVSLDAKAKGYLESLFGGLDDLLKNNLKFENSSTTNLECESSLIDDDLKCVRKATATPKFEFEVRLLSSNQEVELAEQYVYALPDHHGYRLSCSLIREVTKTFNSLETENVLPVFNIPYYRDFFNSETDDDSRVILNHALAKLETYDEPFLINLLSLEWLTDTPELEGFIKPLASSWLKFIHQTDKHGLYAALFAESWEKLNLAYIKVCQQAIANGAEDQTLAAMLLRAFLILRPKFSKTNDDSWHALPYEESGIVTVLHPVFLELIKDQASYLLKCFTYAAQREFVLIEAALDSSKTIRRFRFTEAQWQHYLEAATIKTPLTTLIVNNDLKLSTISRGAGFFHKLGRLAFEGDEPLSTRLLVNADEDDFSEELSFSDLFHNSSESELVQRLLTDYREIHPQALDKLSIGIYGSKNIQPVIAAVHAFLPGLFRTFKRDEETSNSSKIKYAVNLTFFVPSDDAAEAGRWFEQWQSCWEAADSGNKFAFYRKCQITLSCRLINPGGGINDKDWADSFLHLLKEDFEADISLIYDFMKNQSGGNHFKGLPQICSASGFNFPILEKKSCSTTKGRTEKFKRGHLVANRQFKLSSSHMKLIYFIKNGTEPSNDVAVESFGDYLPWQKIIDAFHKYSNWVVCIDPNVDEKLIAEPGTALNQKAREIIGFGSGVGSQGEANFTISTETFSMEDLRFFLGSSIQRFSSNWTKSECQEMANGVISQAKSIAGISIIRATGLEDSYIHDFMAYTLVRKILCAENEAFGETLISLDAYKHWFKHSLSQLRPDLLWLRAAYGENEKLSLKADLIECKFCKKSNEVLKKAMNQINNGIETLSSVFKPKGQGHTTLNPDQRFWWMQLYRLIASKIPLKDSGQKNEALPYLERLAEGDFDISWGASVFAFWVNDPTDSATEIGSWSINTTDAKPCSAKIYTLGAPFILKVACDQDWIAQSKSYWEKSVQHSTTNICTTELADFDTNDMDSKDIGHDVFFDDYDDEGLLGSTETLSGVNDDDDLETESVNIGSTVQPPVIESAIGNNDTPEQIKPSIEIGEMEAMPARVLLGATITSGTPIYWEFGHQKLPNRHMLIFGGSGSGKTFAIKNILCELSRAKQPNLVLDYTNGFIAEQLEDEFKQHIADEQHLIYEDPLPINPFKAQESSGTGKVLLEKPINIARRVASVFKSVYTLGEQQLSSLTDAIKEGLENEPLGGFTLDGLLPILNSYINDKVHVKNATQTVISRLKYFLESNPFCGGNANFSWDQVFEQARERTQVFQFHMMDKDTTRAIVEFVLWDLYSYAAACGHKNNPHIIVLDEIQNLDLNDGAPVAKYLREGRKYGLALICATQTLQGLGGLNDPRISNLFQADLKLFFKPSQNEIGQYAKLMNDAFSSITVQNWKDRLKDMKVGTCWAMGSFQADNGELKQRAYNIKISTPQERNFAST